jgi:hypothetical protein
MRLLSSQSAAHRQCHGCTSQSVHICPKLSNGSCAADLLVETGPLIVCMQQLEAIATADGGWRQQIQSEEDE